MEWNAVHDVVEEQVKCVCVFTAKNTPLLM